MFSPVTRALVEAAGVQAGRNVLDVAGDAGEPSLTLASLVGPSGRVAYTDFVQGMVEAARKASAAITYRKHQLSPSSRGIAAISRSLL